MMTHTYKINGMTCSGCAAKVQYLLSKVPDIESVTVDLEKQQAEISMKEHIDIVDLQESLKGTKYNIIEEQRSAPYKAEAIEEEERVTWKTYFPVFLIFGYITLVTLFVQFIHNRFDTAEWMRQFMAGFFLVLSFFKLLDIPAFAMSYSSYDIVAKKWSGYGFVYPFIELGLGIAFLIPAFNFWTNAVTLLVMGISIIGVLQSVLNKRKIQCACLGAVFKLPMSTITIIEDSLMIVMSGISLLLAK